MYTTRMSPKNGILLNANYVTVFLDKTPHIHPTITLNNSPSGSTAKRVLPPCKNRHGPSPAGFEPIT